MRRLTLTTYLFLLFCLSASANAATLDVVGGQLTGASDVLVDGALYDVEFLDGTCIALFDGCDDPSDFTFADSAAAGLAAQALLDQVFLDGGSGSFDSDSTLTAGCTNAVHCDVYTVFGASATTAYTKNARNHGTEIYDAIFNTNIYKTTDVTTYGHAVYAVWTPVPEPSTALLLGLGLLGLASKRRRRETK